MDLSFSGAGFMGTYYIGVMDCWSRFVPHERVNRVAGASAGSLIAAYFLMDEPLTNCLHDIMGLIEGVRQRTLGVFDRSHQIVDLLPVVLDKLFPDDCHKRASGRLFVAMTRLKDMKKIIVSEFETKKELIDALNCSCFIPLWSGNHCSTYKGEKHIDGGFSDNLPVFDEHTIRICCFSGGSDISPYDRTRVELLAAKVANTPVYFNFSNCRRLGKALFPPPASYILELLRRGFQDARDFMLSNDLIQCEKCFKNTAPENRLLFNVDAPMITPRASPAQSRTNSISENAKLDLLKFNKNKNNVDKKFATLDGAFKQTTAATVSGDEIKKSSFAKMLKQKLTNLTTKQQNIKQRFDDSSQENYNDDDDDNQINDDLNKINKCIPIITTTLYEDDDNNKEKSENKESEININKQEKEQDNNNIDNNSNSDDDDEGKSIECSTNSTIFEDNSSSSKKKLKLDSNNNCNPLIINNKQQQKEEEEEEEEKEEVNIKSQQSINNSTNKSLQSNGGRKNSVALPKGLAIESKFSFAPNSCPPSPSLNRHCAECLRLRQAARNACLDDALIAVAEKYENEAPSKRTFIKGPKIANPVRWMRALRNKHSYKLNNEPILA